MKKTHSFSLRARFRSFQYAFQGLRKAFLTEHNLWIHFVATMSVIALSVILKISRYEAIAVTIVSGMVWMAELFNSAVEKIMDFVSPQKHEQVKIIKDIAAAAVLVTAIAALVTGLFIFLPKLF
ncbi:MAG TPA: diacylglycerol kinase family protein [Chitinophagaceae bacterium]|jgi:diacylglycerol kinase|nr:diacylglycerol kinase family protein [Chitinophagaceae bacterium]